MERGVRIVEVQPSQDAELYRLRSMASYMGVRMTREQQIRILLVDAFMNEIDEILEDRAALRTRYRVLSPMWMTIKETT